MCAGVLQAHLVQPPISRISKLRSVTQPVLDFRLKLRTFYSHDKAVLSILQSNSIIFIKYAQDLMTGRILRVGVEKESRIISKFSVPKRGRR